MSYLSKMYGKKSPAQTQSSSDKNPNCVTGGLKAQGVDHYTVIAEDGSEQHLPTQRYVQSLEEQVRKQRGVITALERKTSRLEQSVRAIEVTVHNIRK